MTQKIFVIGVWLMLFIGISLISFSLLTLNVEGGMSSLRLPLLANGSLPPSGNEHGTIPPLPTGIATPTATNAITATATATATMVITEVPTASPTPFLTPSATAPVTTTPQSTATGTATPTLTPTLTPTATQQTIAPHEGFEGDINGWQVGVDKANGGEVSRSDTQALAGSFAARLTTNSAGASAQIQQEIDEDAANHTWGERPGTWLWQRAYLLIPSATLQQLGEGEYLDLAGFWSEIDQRGWWLRLTTGGALTVYGYDANGIPGEFAIYGQFPSDRWVEVEIGLHSQAGPGVQRAFAVLIDGEFYGWYHQGQLANTHYDHVAMGILSTNDTAPLELFIDQWYATTSDQLPAGSDHRSTADLQEQDYRTGSGVQWQIDWSTWRENLALDKQFGLYSITNRLQSGRNLDRMRNLTDGWAEIEIDWPQGTPPTAPNSYFGPMVGFRKEINREENLEVIPIGAGDGSVNLVLEAWIGSPVILAGWPLPPASIGGGSHIPEAGDIIRVRWQQLTESKIQVWASYYDASTATWHTDIINHVLDGTQIGESQFGLVDYSDGYHVASSVTIDSPYYSIRRYKVGAFETYP